MSRMRSSSVVKLRSSVSKTSASGRYLIVVPVSVVGSPFSRSPSGLPRSNDCVHTEPVAAYLDVEALGQRVHDRDADAVKAARDLVAAALAELAAGVKHRQHDLDGRPLLLLHDRHGDSATVVATVTELSGWIVIRTSSQ